MSPPPPPRLWLDVLASPLGSFQLQHIVHSNDQGYVWLCRNIAVAVVSYSYALMTRCVLPPMHAIR